MLWVHNFVQLKLRQRIDIAKLCRSEVKLLQPLVHLRWEQGLIQLSNTVSWAHGVSSYIIIIINIIKMWTRLLYFLIKKLYQNFMTSVLFERLICSSVLLVHNVLQIWEIVYAKDGSVKEVSSVMQLKGHKVYYSYYYFWVISNSN